MTNKTITLQDVCENCSCKEKEYFIDMTDFYVEDYRDIMSHLKPRNIGGIDVTIMDLFNLPLNDNQSIINFIKERLNIDIETKDGIKKINNLFNEAVNFYEKRYLRNIPLKFKRLNFRKTESIINFLKETKTNKTSGILNCVIAKICYSLNDVLENEKIRRELFLDRQFISEYLEKPFQITEEFEDKNGNIYNSGIVVIDGKQINFKMISRQKGKESIIGKQISDAKYYSIEEFRDLVGVTIYVNTDWEAALMMQYIDQMIYHGKAKIKNKNGLDLMLVKQNVSLNEEFYLKLEEQTKISIKEESEDEKEFNEKTEKLYSNDKKNITSKNYREIKLIGTVELSLEDGKRASKYPIGTEIKFVIDSHDNEKGLSFHPIYNYLKRFKELTRLGIPIRKLDIVNYVNDFFENIEENLKKKNKDKETYYKELFKDLLDGGFIKDDFELTGDKINEKVLALGLYKYFESKLIKIKFPNSKKEYYFEESILKMRDIGLFKEIEKV